MGKSCSLGEPYVLFVILVISRFAFKSSDCPVPGHCLFYLYSTVCDIFGFCGQSF